MNVDLIGNIAPIYLIGDSHCLQFTEVMFATREPPMRFRSAVIFFFHLPSNEYIVDGAANPKLTQALTSEGILNAKGEAAWLEPDSSTTYLSGRPALSPTMAFFAGEVDLQYLMSQLGGDFDFELPDDPGYGVNFDKSPAPFSVIQARVEAVLGPFVEVMADLRKSFPGLMVHALPPRDRDDDRSQRWSFNVKVSAAVRAKLVLVANRYLAGACARLDIPFIDPWDDLSAGGFTRPDFELDGMHLNRATTSILLERIVDTMLDNSQTRANPTRYEVMKEHFSPAYLGPFHPSSLSWTESGYLLDKLPVSDIAAFTDGRPFELAETNPRVSVEWAGYPRTGRPGVAMAQPSQQTLARAETLFSSSHARSIIQVGDGRELTIANFRPVELAPETTVTASTIPSPPGCRRALLFLSESSSIVVADTIGNVLVQKSVRVGAIAVWDPKRIAIFAKSRTTPIRVIEIMLMPRHRAYPFRVAWTGLNDWPADPFHYTVGDIPASPPFETDLVRERP